MELAELYSYSETTEWANNLDSFDAYMRHKNLSPVWMSLDKREKQAVLADLVQRMEHVSGTERLEAAKIVLYILQVTKKICSLKLVFLGQDISCNCF